MLKPAYPRFVQIIAVLAVGLGAVSGVTRADPAPPVPEPRFDIREYVVEGNTVLPRQRIETAIYPYLGPAKTMADVQAARQKLEEAYRQAGYKTVAVSIPEQRVVGGLVKLQVIEGRVGKVRVKGARYYLPSRIRGELQALTPGRVPHLPSMQEELTAINRAGNDRQVTPVFRAGTTPGTVDVDLRVRDSLPLHASLEINNRYSANTDALRAIGTLRYDNLWQREHSLSLLYQTAPREPSQVTAYSATYLLRSGDALDMTVLYGLHSSSNLAVLGGTTVIGSGTIAGVRKIFTLPAPPGSQQGLSFGIDYKSFAENVNLGTNTITTPIRYLPMSVLYNGSRYRPGSVTLYNAGLNFSVRGLADVRVDCVGQDLDQFECKRHGASSNYAYLKIDVQNTREFSGGWALDVHGDAQFASAPLISNEQYSIGGLTSVRGYLEAERLGDGGWHASVEARTPSWGSRASKSDDVYGLLFYDTAAVRMHNPLPEQQPYFHLRAAGIGVRFNVAGGLKGELHWAYAFDNAVATQKGDYRVQCRVEYGF